MAQLTFALPKGRLLKKTVELLKKAGIDASEVLEDTRKLIFKWKIFEFVLVKPFDVPTYVFHGAADLGVVGKDVLLEKSLDVYEPLDLKFGACRLSVAEPVGMSEPYSREKLSFVKVATKYPRITDSFFRSMGIHPEIVVLYGSVEIAPILGLSERIVDLVQTGRTLKENGLREVDTILHSTARLIVNKASLKTKHKLIKPLISRLKGALAES